MSMFKNRKRYDPKMEAKMEKLKKDLVPMTVFNMNIQKKLHAKFKIACTRRDQKMTDVIIGFIEQYLSA